MPKRKDLKSIMVIGAGPIIIGQACEFDYSGTQACKALKDEGYKVILVNSNPATIMTDPDLADVTYIEPIEKDSLEKIIKIEKPNAILPTMGGQTALNKSIELYKDGVLKKFNIELIGANPQSILKAENRLTFRDSMGKVGIMSPKSEIANNSKQALKIVENLGYPVIIRPSFTLGGTGGGIAKNKKQFLEIVRRGLDLSPVKEILIEESLIGWKEYEMEVIRDKKDNCIIICSIENVDPMGIHTGDSITVAPALTLTDKEYQIMRDASILCLREVGVETGGSNVQFAINPKNGDLRIIEMNPRVSRSSALASKATGFPIAKVATKLAVGYTLDELKNEITKVTPASFEPTIDYVVTKIPRFDFEKFSSSEPLLTTSMKSVGEVMAIGRTFQESLQKALRSTEIGLNGLNDINDDLYKKSSPKNLILKDLKKFHFDRILKIAQALRNKISIKEIYSATKIDLWFLEQIKEIIDVENDIKKRGIPKNANKLNQIKSMGFSDLRLAELANVNQRKIRALRQKMKVTPVYKRVDTCSAEFESFTPYMYSTYKKDLNNFSECESKPLNRRKVIILGGGPNRIGQGIEFDYCCCHASYALRELGYETIMINCNPETVSTDYDTSDRLYFEPLAVEDILEITKVEQKKGNLKGVIIQFGGQTPLKISRELESLKIPILGTSVKTIDLTEDRKKFKKFLKTINLTQPKNGIAYSKEEAEIIAKKIQYPVVIRPSYVLGGRAMEIAYNQKEIKGFFSSAAKISGDDPILVDKFLDEAIEVDVDALCDGKEVYIAGIMEHIEKAGIHSGDSACTLPPHTLNKKTIEEIRRQTNILAKKLNVKGLINIQYAIKNNVIYILEVNPRASRTIPFVSKATGTPVVKIATKLMMGKKLKSFKLKERKLSYTAVKEAVFSFEKFPGSDILLGPEMKSTGEVMGIDKEFSQAFAKSQIASNNHLPLQGTAFISVKEKDKFISLDLARQLISLNFNILATRGTQAFFNKNGLKSNRVNKVYEGSPHVVNFMQEKKIDLVINTTQGRQAITDSFSLRRAALTNDIPYFTTIVAAQNAILSIKSLLKEELQVKPLQHYY